MRKLSGRTVEALLVEIDQLGDVKRRHGWYHCKELKPGNC